MRVAVFVRSEYSNALVGDGVLQPAPRSANLDSAFGVACIKLLYGPGIAFPGLALSQDIVDMVGLYNIYTDTEPPRARPGPVRHGHPRPPEGPRPRRGAAASQIRPQSTGTRSGDLTKAQ